MKNCGDFHLHLHIRLNHSPDAAIGKAIGMLLTQYLTPRMVTCSCELANSTACTRRAARVLKTVLCRPRLVAGGPNSARIRNVVVDDNVVKHLADQWDVRAAPDFVVIVPHIFYEVLLRYFLHNVHDKAPHLYGRLRIFFDYAELEDAPEPLVRCFLNERERTMRLARAHGMPYFDSGRQLLLENVISAACYMSPARSIVFLDDDFLLRNEQAVQDLLQPLDAGYVMSGMYDESSDRIHTSFFGLRPSVIRDALLIFDDGVNLYSDPTRDTGSIFYSQLKPADKGAFILQPYSDTDETYGIHLGHCASEIWCDFPQIVAHQLPSTTASGDVREMLVSLARVLRVENEHTVYHMVKNPLRKHARQDMRSYIEEVYANHMWLERQVARTGCDCD